MKNGNYIINDTIVVIPWSITNELCIISADEVCKNPPNGYSIIGIVGVIPAANWTLRSFDVSNGNYAIMVENNHGGSIDNVNVTVRRLHRKII